MTEASSSQSVSHIPGNIVYETKTDFAHPYLGIHPQVSGKPQVILLHERLIEWINGHEGVEWVTMEQIVDEFKSGNLSGATVEGGADV